MALLIALTLMPAMLGFAGAKVTKFFSLPGRSGRTERTARRAANEPERTAGAGWARFVVRHRITVLIGGIVLLGAIALPAVKMQLGLPSGSSKPVSNTQRKAYDLLSEGFGPGFNGPLLLAGALRSPGDEAVMARLATTIAADPGVAQVSPPVVSPNGQGILVQVVPRGSPQDASTTELVHRLRSNTVPAVTRGSTLKVYVGGQTAIGVDLADTLGQRLPYMFLAILLFSFVLLMLVFRSLLVPLKAVIMNLLSIGAAYGVIVAIFQWGWLKSLVGIGKQGPIEAWVPMMLFAIVFGLSMDYEVFLLSRIKEEYDRDGDNATAVAHGLAKTARLITAAAAIMICVFGSFVLSDLRVLKLVGFGLAFAVLIDATVVRLVLVPATMELLGDRNWWFPKALEWLPRIQIEGEPIETVEGVREPATVGGT
jgi:RND superfamily putative drug exporter